MDSCETIFNYFPDLSDFQKKQFETLGSVISDWNSKVNLISRKDLENFYLRHVLHSLGISKVIGIEGGSRIIDIGTGGGFPGLPLAILRPDISFHLVDSIRKKINAVESMIGQIGLQNTTTEWNRAENVNGKFDYAVSRAVAPLGTVWGWVRGTLERSSIEPGPGLLYLKGGDLEDELRSVKSEARIFELKDHFEDEFFDTKKVVYIRL